MRSSTKTVVCSCIAVVLLVPAWAADPATPSASPAPAATTPADIVKLKAQLDRQQKEIEQLLAALAAQRKMLEQAGMASPAADRDQAPQHATPADRLIASTTPMALPARNAGAEPGGSLGQPATGAGSGRRPRRGVLSAAAQNRQYHHHAGRVHGPHGVVERQERRGSLRQQLRQRPLQQCRHRQALRIQIQPPELADRFPRGRRLEGRSFHRL